MNIILIAIDTLRADHLECYGYERETSPALAELAGDGILYESFFAPSIPTDPSFASLFTGLPDYGHRIAGVLPGRPVPEQAPWLTELLTGAGYHTCAVDNLEGHAEFFRRGFEEYEWPGMAREKGKREKRNGERVTAAALQMLEEAAGQQPLFMFLHYWDPHTPYLPPPPYDGMFYEGDPTDPARRSMRECRVFPGPGVGWIEESVTDADYVSAQYDAEIAYNAEHLGAFLGELKARGLYEESLVVAFSDHGEVLTGHEGPFDHHGLYDDNLHVPLIIKPPGGEEGGSRVAAMVQMVDLPVTLLTAAGLTVPGAMRGTDLLSLADGSEGAPYESLYLGEGTWQVKRGVRTRGWKFIRAASDTYRHNWHGSPPRELYDLERDPREQVNLVAVEPEVVGELERRLDGWLAGMKERWGWEDPLVEFGPTLQPELEEVERHSASDLR